MRLNSNQIIKTALALCLWAMAAISYGQANTPLADMPAGVYKLDDSHASVTWKVSHLGLSNYTARFTRFDADIQFNPKNVEKSTVVVSIDPTSIETDYPRAEKKDFDQQLIQKPEWFNATKFPEITFESTGLKKGGGQNMVMEGKLTLLGVSKLVMLDVTFNGAMAKQPFSKKPTLGFSAEGRLKRSDFGMATYIPNIGDEVIVIVEAEFAKND